MSTQQLITADKYATVVLTAGEFAVRLVVSLSQQFHGGELVRVNPTGTIAVDGADSLSASYNQRNWISGVASGALYAFRALGVPRQCLLLSELSGRLRSSDMSAVANASALAIAKLAEKDLPSLPTEGWAIQVQIAERPSADRETQPRSIGRRELEALSSKHLVAILALSGNELSSETLAYIHDIAASRAADGDDESEILLGKRKEDAARF